MMKKNILSITLALSIALATSAVWAEEPTTAGPVEGVSPVAGPEEPTLVENARFQYNEGLRLFADAQFHASKGNTPAQKRVLKESLKKFEQALEMKPDFTEAESNIGYVYLTMEDYKKAIATFNSVAAKKPHHLGTLNGLATAYTFNSQIDEAVRTFDQLTLLAPGHVDYLYNYGSALQGAGRIEEAQTQYEKALRVDPRHQRTLFNMGTLLQNQGKYAEAESFYERAKTTDISNTIGLQAMSRIKEIEFLMSREQNAAETPTAN